MPNYTNKALYEKIKKIEGDAELKYKDTLINYGQPEAIANTVIPLALIGQSLDQRGRIGDFVRHTSMKIRLLFKFTPNNTVNSVAFIRPIIFYDSEPGGNIPNVIPLLAGDEAVLDLNSGSIPILYQYDYGAMFSRFKILYDDVITLQSAAGTTYIPEGEEPGIYPVPVARYWKRTVKLGRKSVFSGTDGVIANMQTNGLFITFLYYTPDYSSADPDTLVVEGGIRVYYKDQ